MVIWGHGWAQDHSAFDKIIGALQGIARHIVVDFPGFGASPMPFARIEDSWSSQDYADAFVDFIKEVGGGRPVIWIGHSFGCRVGAQLAAHYPDLIKGLVFIAGAGLKRKRSLWQQGVLKTKIYSYKLGKYVMKWPFIADLIRKTGLAGRVGSVDYQKAGPMRGVLVSVVNENLIEEARSIQCPALLLYGDKDTETPPDIGRRYNQLIKDSSLVSLSGQDHYSVLGEGRHQVTQHIKQFIGHL